MDFSRLQNIISKEYLLYIQGGMVYGSFRSTVIKVIADSEQEAYEAAKAWCKDHFKDMNHIHANYSFSGYGVKCNIKQLVPEVIHLTKSSLWHRGGNHTQYGYSIQK